MHRKGEVRHRRSLTSQQPRLDDCDAGGLHDGAAAFLSCILPDTYFIPFSQPQWPANGLQK